MASRKSRKKSHKRQILLEQAVRVAGKEGDTKESRRQREQEERERLRAFKQEETRKLQQVRSQMTEVRNAIAAEEEAMNSRPAVLSRELRVTADRPAPSGLAGSIRDGLRKTRDSLAGALGRIMPGGKNLDRDALEKLEEVLITADLGVQTTRRLIGAVEDRIRRGGQADFDRLRIALRDEIRHIMDREYPPAEVDGHQPAVILFVGVNGVGKTTTIGKMAAQFTAGGRKVLLAAGDTFRAPAAEQLAAWGQRAGCAVFQRHHGADPSSVLHQAIATGIEGGYDLVLCDTAGRLHTKTNLMEELKKIKRVIGKVLPGAPHETWLVLDANTGQNAILQTRDFHQALDLTGIVVTKLDGTARGGVVLGIVNEFDLPIRYAGVGEGTEDLKPFDPILFADSLLD